MPSIGRQFGKGEGVPRSKEALAALGVGVDEKGSKGLEREREGAKGSDEIGLSAGERESVENLESERWDMDQLVKWADEMNPTWGKAWVERRFRLHNDGTIECKQSPMRLTSPRIKELPPHLHGGYIKVGSELEKLPRGMQTDILDLRNAGQLKEFPPDLVVEGYLKLRYGDHHLIQQADQLDIGFVTYEPV